MALVAIHLNVEIILAVTMLYLTERFCTVVSHFLACVLHGSITPKTGRLAHKVGPGFHSV